MLKGLYWSETLSKYHNAYSNMCTGLHIFLLLRECLCCFISMNLLKRGPMTLMKTLILIMLGQESAN